MPYLMTERGVAWNYEIAGNGETIVFIHGWAADRRVWSLQFEHFKKTYKVISLDLPGHGQSGWTDMSLEDIAYDFDFLLRALGEKDINLVASSMGSLVALRYYESFESKVKRLVFVGGLPRFARSKDHPFGLAVPRIRKLREQVREDFPDILNVFFRSLFTIREREGLRIKWLQMFQENESGDLPDKEALEKYLTILEKEDLSRVISKIRVPAFVLAGDEDYICSQESLRHFHSIIPGAEIKFFCGCGHFPFLSEPDEFNECLNYFLKGEQGPYVEVH